MATSRRQSNGRSFLVNQQRQITSFFTNHISNLKSSSSPNPNASPKQSQSPAPAPAPAPSPSPTTPSPLQTKSKKPLLVVSASPSPSPSPLTPGYKKSYGDEVVGKRIRVYWPLDKSWYEGCVKSFDQEAGKHLVQYDDAEEEMLELEKEKIEWVEESVKKFKRLRRGGSLGTKSDVVEKTDSVEETDSGNDSSDDDWAKSGEKEMLKEEEEDMDVDEEKEEEEEEETVGKRKGKKGRNSVTRKRKIDVGKVESAKKSKSSGNDCKGGVEVSPMEPKSKVDSM